MAGKFLAKKEKNGKFLTYFLPVLLVVFAVVSVIAAVKILQVRKERAAGKEAYDELAQSIVTVRQPVPQMDADASDQEELPDLDMSDPAVDVNFDALQAITGHAVAWICSGDWSINYPVVRGTDNDYYLNHLPDGTVNRNGSVFMDFRNEADLSDRNTFIYGHNMRDGAMFASLSRYFEEPYRTQYPELLLITRNGSFSLQVFAGSVVSGNSDLYQLSYRDDEEFGAYVEKVRMLSDFSFDVQVGKKDRIVTLSTCAYHYEDARYVLFCKLVPIQ